MYAVAEAAVAAQSGVIFFLHQRNAGLGRNQQPANPVHPHYFSYIHRNGNIRFGYDNAQQILAVFEDVAAGKGSSITELCDRFDSETNQGQDMVLYDNLLNDVIGHLRQAHANTQIRQLRPGGARAFVQSTASETPDGASGFELRLAGDYAAAVARERGAPIVAARWPATDTVGSHPRRSTRELCCLCL